MIRFSVIRIRKVQFVICCHVALKQFYKLDNSIIRKKNVTTHSKKAPSHCILVTLVLTSTTLVQHLLTAEHDVHINALFASYDQQLDAETLWAAAVDAPRA